MKEEDAVKYAERYPEMLGATVPEILRKKPTNSTEAMTLIVRIFYYTGHEIKKRRKVKNE